MSITIRALALSISVIATVVPATGQTDTHAKPEPVVDNGEFYGHVSEGDVHRASADDGESRRRNGKEWAAIYQKATRLAEMQNLLFFRNRDEVMIRGGRSIRPRDGRQPPTWRRPRSWRCAIFRRRISMAMESYGAGLTRATRATRPRARRADDQTVGRRWRQWVVVRSMKLNRPKSAATTVPSSRIIGQQ